ncbi:MAG: hypothetical protein D3926_10785 [Desulfobacteraceae bacterium]|nr:MAG: hypothetical protein D3926_10785 [Desulfobacteraceae bacterium]
MKYKIKTDSYIRKGVLTLFTLMSIVTNLSSPAFSESSKGIEQIKIVTPEWNNQTNRDGSGLFFDILKQVFAPHDISMAFDLVPWKRAQSLVNAGSSDAMLCVWAQHAREEGQITPRYPLFIEHTAVIYKKEKIHPWNGISSLDQRSAIWLTGYDYHHFDQFKNITFLRYGEVDSHDKAWLQLNLGRYDVYIDALIDLDLYIRKNDVDMQLYNKKILWAERAFVAFSPSERSKTLARIYDEQIQVLFRSGQLARIYQKWDITFYPEYWQE